jgi:ribosomal protein S14
MVVRFNKPNQYKCTIDPVTTAPSRVAVEETLFKAELSRVKAPADLRPDHGVMRSVLRVKAQRATLPGVDDKILRGDVLGFKKKQWSMACPCMEPKNLFAQNAIAVEATT